MSSSVHPKTSLRSMSIILLLVSDSEIGSEANFKKLSILPLNVAYALSMFIIVCRPLKYHITFCVLPQLAISEHFTVNLHKSLIGAHSFNFACHRQLRQHAVGRWHIGLLFNIYLSFFSLFSDALLELSVDVVVD